MIDAIYFDGETAQRHPVTIVIHKRVVAMRGDGVHRTERLSKLDISERLQHAPRILRFPDGAFMEVSDSRLDKALRENRYRDPLVVRWQNNWPLSLLALISLLTLLICAYQWGVPWAADRIAQNLPSSIEKKIGDQELVMLDDEYMAPSKLAPSDQERLQRLFSELKQPRGEKTAYRLEFRASGIGPNAFALPNGVIVMTDELVQIAANDQAVMAVLGHELGHLQRRHSLRRLLQTIGVGVVLNLWVGDVSSALAAVPTFLLDQKYSRDFEREADQYAIDMMRANAVPLSPMAELFERMSAGRDARRAGASGGKKDDRSDGSASGNDADESEEDDKNEAQRRRDTRKGKDRRVDAPDYFSSHPSDQERIAKLRAADEK